MILVTIIETTETYNLELPDYVKTIKQLKNNILSFKKNYKYDNLKLVLIDNNFNDISLSDSSKIYPYDNFILCIAPINIDS